MKSLTLRGISVRLGDAPVLDAVDLSLSAGDATMLVGPNGAGKSTLIKVLLGLVRPDAGAIEIDGAAARVDHAFKARLGYLPEAVAFSENLTGRQVMRFFASARAVAPSRARDVLERVGLAAAAGRAIRGYSRGMRQRLGLGVAILAEPELLILDEPTSGLDQEGLAVLWSVLEEWQRAGRMVLASSHDLALMERHVDAICVLREGRRIAYGSAEELRRAVALPHRVTLTLQRGADAEATRLFEAIDRWGRARVERAEGRIVVEVEADGILELMALQSGFKDAIRSLRVEEPGMDLVYDALLEAG